MELEITINKYINGELRGTALEEFEALLKKDKALQEEVQFHMEVDKTLVIHEEVENNKNLKSLLSNLGETHIQDKAADVTKTVAQKKQAEIIANPEIFKENEWKIRKSIPFALLAAAAAFLLFMFLPSLQKQSNLEIAESKFQLYQLNDNVMGEENTSKIYEEAKRNYYNGNLKKANQQFNSYLQEIPNAPKVWLAKGSTEFKLGDIDTALNSFENVIKMDESGIYHSNAHWYLAMCHLKKDNTEKAIAELKKIQKGQDYYKEAQDLLNQL